ncbi:threonine--tRNA ligase [Acholeplasma sp. OttesenSCG-928-E16]|nr:threonine--tRNA ligase [Acholeplasma sp. OttesenSCG-928-E16]
MDIRKNEKLSILNHSCAHLMAHAVKRLYPEARFWVGPTIESGFYYDIDLNDKVIKDSDLPEIEKMMKKIAKEAKLIKRIELTKKEALEMFKDDPYKIDLINNMSDDEVISAYQQAEFIDLCRGPHVENTKMIKHFRLLKVSGAYFKGDSNNKMLQRIYGICFENEEDLTNYLHWLEEAKLRDHKKLGKELGLFMISEYGPGMPFWLPNGMILRNALENYWYKIHALKGYHFTKTPIMLSKELWELSGHWDNYQENMYTSKVDDKDFAIKPMNCPGGMLVFKNGFFSYRDLPYRLGELGLVHRHEASGALNGLFRVRSFTQDDAHIFMRHDQIVDEIIDLISLVDEIYSLFNLSYSIELSTRPEHFIGEISDWDKSEDALKEAMNRINKPFRINEGDGAFYGPKLDFHIRDSLNRVWQCGTIQLDMNLPERFDLTYVDFEGNKVRPVMLHRAIFGSVERFIGILIEHYAGAFPLWLSPKQIMIIPVHPELHNDYASKVLDRLSHLGYRVFLDSRNEKLGYRLREAQVNKIPIQLVIGDSEVENGTVNVREHGSKDSVSLSLDDFINNLEENYINPLK